MASAEELKAFFDTEFPGNNLEIESVGNQSCRVRRTPKITDLRPGNTVSGPFMMSMADTALYVAILGELGLIALAVTTNLNINFFHKPVPESDMIAECQLLKVGKRLVVGEVTLYSEGSDKKIAHAVGTYSIPKTS